MDRLKEINKQLENRIIRAEIENKVLQEMLKKYNNELQNNEKVENPATEKTSVERLKGT